MFSMFDTYIYYIYLYCYSEYITICMLIIQPDLPCSLGSKIASYRARASSHRMHSKRKTLYINDLCTRCFGSNASYGSEMRKCIKETDTASVALSKKKAKEMDYRGLKKGMRLQAEADGKYWAAILTSWFSSRFLACIPAVKTMRFARQSGTWWRLRQDQLRLSESCERAGLSSLFG